MKKILVLLLALFLVASASAYLGDTYFYSGGFVNITPNFISLNGVLVCLANGTSCAAGNASGDITAVTVRNLTGGGSSGDVEIFLETDTCNTATQQSVWNGTAFECATDAGGGIGTNWTLSNGSTTELVTNGEQVNVTAGTDMQVLQTTSQLVINYLGGDHTNLTSADIEGFGFVLGGHTNLSSADIETFGFALGGHTNLSDGDINAFGYRKGEHTNVSSGDVEAFGFVLGGHTNLSDGDIAGFGYVKGEHTNVTNTTGLNLTAGGQMGIRQDYPGQTSITTLGTVVTGTYNAILGTLSTASGALWTTLGDLTIGDGGDTIDIDGELNLTQNLTMNQSTRICLNGPTCGARIWYNGSAVVIES